MPRMISQCLAEESPDFALPYESTRPWLRRRVEQNEGNDCSKLDVDSVLSRDGIAHVEK